MHMVIYALVEASTEDEALAAGTAVFQRLVGAEIDSCAVFDYYDTFDGCRSGGPRLEHGVVDGNAHTVEIVADRRIPEPEGTIIPGTVIPLRMRYIRC